MEKESVEKEQAEQEQAHDMSRARLTITEELGQDTILRLHRERPALDWLVLIGLPILFVANGTFLTLHAHGWAWRAVFVLQGFVLLSFGYVMHELCAHRQVGGKRFSYWYGVFAGILSFLRSREYRHLHMDHHRYPGTDRDEEYKQDLDKLWKRWLFLTPIGLFLASRGVFHKPRPPFFPSPKEAFQAARRDRAYGIEIIVRLIAYVTIGVLILLDYKWVSRGFIVPALIALPIVNAIRVVLEHSETNPGHPFHCATYYRCRLPARVLFFWDAGDLHLIHHIFPAIPFYHLTEAARLMRPLLLREGVRERRSILYLLYGFFIVRRPHRTLWA